MVGISAACRAMPISRSGWYRRRGSAEGDAAGTATAVGGTDEALPSTEPRSDAPKPELVANGPKCVWSCDITRLKGPCSGASYHLYVVIDIYSRYVVGWAVFERERQELTTQLIETRCQRQGITPGQLTVHADGGAAMHSREVAELLARLNVRKSHSRPSDEPGCPRPF